MLQPIRQTLPPPPSTGGQAPVRRDSGAEQYRASWNPSTPSPLLPPLPLPQDQPLSLVSSVVGAVSDGDVRALASTVRDGIGNVVEAGRDGITSTVNWAGGRVGDVADLARSTVTGDNLLSNSVRGLISFGEQTVRFQIGVAGGVAREAVGLVGTVGQLGTTLVEASVSPQARLDLGRSLISTGSAIIETGGRYLLSVVADPTRLGSDLHTTLGAAGGLVESQIGRYGDAIRQGNGAETIGIDVGTVATYVVPIGGGPARAAIGGATLAGGQTILRGGTTLMVRGGDDIAAAVVRQAPGAVRTAADDAAGLVGRTTTETVPQLRPAALPVARADLPPEILHARAQMAEYVYGRGVLPAGARQVEDAAELARLNLTPAMLNKGAFHAEVYATGASGGEAYTVVFQGSNGQVGDWVTNGLQGVGLPSNHYARALEIGKAIGRVDPAVDVGFVGHSLGGGLASHAANASGRHAVTFNAAGLHVISQAQGVTVAASNGVLPGTVDNFFVPMEILTTAQSVVPLMPRALGQSHVLPSVMPDGASALSHYGPLAPINRHLMSWVLASTAPRSVP